MFERYITLLSFTSRAYWSLTSPAFFRLSLSLLGGRSGRCGRSRLLLPEVESEGGDLLLDPRARRLQLLLGVPGVLRGQEEDGGLDLRSSCSRVAL